MKEHGFKGVALRQVSRVKGINRVQFLQSLIDAIDRRMFTLGNASLHDYAQVISDLNILDPSAWPTDISESVTFSDKNIKRLASVFRVSDGEIHQKFREYVASGAKQSSAIAPLLKNVSLVPTNTAECERGFHATNLTLTALRSSLQVSIVANCRFVSCAGPPLPLFNTPDYAKAWMRRGRHAATETQALVCIVEIKSDISPIWKYL